MAGIAERAFKTVTLFSTALLLSSCLSLTEGAGRFLEGKLNHAVRRYRGPGTLPKGRGYQVLERADGGGLDILIEAFPCITLRASVPEANGNFYLKSLDYLGGNASGWVEFSLILSGGGVFIAREGGLSSLRLKPPTEAVLISGGKIRRESVLLSGEDALRALNNRYERILALVEWMRGPQAAALIDATDTIDGIDTVIDGIDNAAGAGIAAGGESIGQFEARWKPLLLPELVPRKKRPRLYGEGARWVRAEEVRWNSAYTEKILPEELRSLRDSGTLKRDWEESREWIFLIYAWDHIFNTLETSAVGLWKK